MQKKGLGILLCIAIQGQDIVENKLMTQSEQMQPTLKQLIGKSKLKREQKIWGIEMTFSCDSDISTTGILNRIE